ncbi:MAG: hypothetical protein OXI16_14360 [Chloroflexota bacterium]|nr:hypothetical protein [Chloroflexota bacterium]
MELPSKVAWAILLRTIREAQSYERDACMHWLAISAEGDDAIVGEWDVDCLSAKAAPGKSGERRASTHSPSLRTRT